MMPTKTEVEHKPGPELDALVAEQPCSCPHSNPSQIGHSGRCPQGIAAKIRRLGEE
jgi:hypothetical protein